MKRTDKTVKIASVVSGILTEELKLRANSTSCILMHQPKEPKGMERFKKANR